MKTLAISGIDGSGKSTVAFLLKKYFYAKDVKVKILWFRWRALTLYGLYLYSKFRGLYIRIYVPKLRHRVGIHVLHADHVTKTLYPYLLFLDLVVYHLLNRFLMKFQRFKVVIYDRFFIDALIDTIYTCRYTDRLILRLYLSMQRKISRAIVLNVDVDIALKRKNDIISRKEIEFKKKLYLIFSKYLQIPVVDASQDLATVISNVYSMATSKG